MWRDPGSNPTRRPMATPPARRTSWRPQRHRRIKLKTRRFLMVFLALGLVGSLVALLVQPFQHPRTHLLVVRGPQSHADLFEAASVLPAQQFVTEDIAALQPLIHVLDGHDAKRGIPELAFDAPAGALSLGERIGELADDPRDVLMVYVAGWGIADQSTPFLAFPAGSQAGLANRISVHQLLGQFDNSRAEVKLLIIEAGPSGFASREEILNEFPLLLKQAVEATGDRSLWVLLSHATGERSYSACALRQSMFGAFVSQGLLGAADLDHNHTVSMDELFRYVAANVSDRVRRTTGGSVAQHPQLFWGGGKIDVARAAVATLAPVPANDRRAATADSSVPVSPPKAGAIPTATVSQAAQVAQVPRPRRPTTSVPAATTLPQQAEPATQKTVNAKEQADAEKKTDAQQAGAPPSAPDKAPPTTADSKANPPPQDAPAAVKPLEKTSATPDSAASALSPALPQTPRDLLALAWRLRDDLESGNAQDNPIAYAPHHWRTFQEQLVQLEWLVRTAPAADAQPPNSKQSDNKPPKELSPLTPLLQNIVESLTAMRAESPKFAVDAPETLQRIHAALPQRGVDPASVTSMGMAERLIRPLPPDIDQAVRQFDLLLEAGSRQDLQEWIKKCPPGLRRYSEIRLSAALIPLVDVDWETLRLALRVRRLAERAAANSWTTSPPYRGAIERADRFRRAGERILVDQIGTDRGTSAQEQLQEAQQQYRQVLADADGLETIARLQRELTFRASWYVAWHRAGGTATGVPDIADLLPLLETLREVTMELHSSDSPDLAKLRRTDARLRGLQAAVETSLDTPNIVSLTNPPIILGDGWQIESLLATPLPKSAARSSLMDHVDAVHAAVADQWSPPVVPNLIPVPRSPTVADWQRLGRIVDIELELLRLAAFPWTDSEDLLGEARTRRDQFQILFEQRAQGTGLDANDTLKALREFEDALKSAYGQLAIQIRQELSPSTSAPQPEIENNLRHLEIALHTLRVCGGARIDVSDIQQPTADLRRLQSLQLVRRQHERILTAFQDAPSTELEDLKTAADECQQLARQLSHREWILTNGSTNTHLDGPSSISLILQDRTEFQMEVSSSASGATPAWIILDYDPKLLRVEPISRQAVHRRDLLRDKLRQLVLDNPTGAIPARAAEYPLRPDLASLPPSLMIPAGASTVLPLAIERIPGTSGPARLVVKAVVDGQVVRHEIEIATPQTELLDLRVTGVPQSWSENSGSLILYPYPNRTTNYQVSLVNNGSEPRNVSIELFSLGSGLLPSLPTGGLPAADADRILVELDLQTPLVSLPKIEIPNGGAPVPIPFPKLPAQAAAPPPSGGTPTQPSGDASIAQGGASSAPGSSPGNIAAIDKGMLFLIRDQQSGFVLLKPIRVLPQSPRRFLRVDAGYDPRRQRVEVKVRPTDPARLPPGGVRVSCEFAQPLPSDAEQKLEDVLATTDGEARLYAVVSARPGRVETVFVNVDDFPRAFIYRIDCSSGEHGASEVTDRLAVRITNPPQGTAYRVPRPFIPIDLQVDAPTGAFQTDGDFLEVGIDVDQDGEFQDESPLRLYSDRQVEAALAQTTPQGGLAVATRIGDFSLSLPALGVQNQHVNLLARVHVGGRSVWSQEVETVFDGLPPRVTQIRLNPARHAELGKPVTVLIETSDDGLSGVATVETTLDLQHNGQFGPMPPPTPARRDDQGRWRSVLATSDVKTGTYSVLVRATDQVGNVSDIARAEIEIVTAEQATAMRKAAAVTRINGLVLVGGKPAPGIDVTLKADDKKAEDMATDGTPPTFAPTQSDDDGAFVFSSVPPGKYTVSASGVLFNQTRTSTTEIIVDPAPQPLTVIELRLE